MALLADPKPRYGNLLEQQTLLSASILGTAARRVAAGGTRWSGGTAQPVSRPRRLPPRAKSDSAAAGGKNGGRPGQPPIANTHAPRGRTVAAGSSGGAEGGEEGHRRSIPPKLYRIGEVVEYSGLSRQTIHNYTTMGLLREAKWTDGGHRLYSVAVFERLDQIAKMKADKKTLHEIRTHFVRLDEG